MKFATFNIRYDTDADGINSFTHRQGGILKAIDTQKCDVIGFQEARPHVFMFLKRYLTDYEVVGCGRGSDYEGEHNPIAYLKNKYELIGLETQWLSPTPRIPGTRYENQSNCPRIVTRATLREYGSDKPFYVFNTHLDHISEEARVLGANKVCDIMKEMLALNDMPLVLMGDFNAYPDTKPIEVFMSDCELSLTEHTRDIEMSYHGYGEHPEPRIDYIMSRGFAEVSPASAWKDMDNGIYLSDHYPISVELER